MKVELVGALRRCWYVAAAGLVASAGVAFLVWSASPPAYAASGSIILMPSDRQASVSGNPFLAIAYMDGMSGVIMAGLDGAEQRAAMAERFPDVTYEVGPDLTTRGPTIRVAVTGESVQETMGALDTLLDAASERLASLQTDAAIAPESVIGWMNLARDDEPTMLTEGAIEAAARAGVAGLVVTAGLTVGADLLARRGRRH